MKPVSKEEIATLVAIVGRTGAISALEQSKTVNSEDLLMLAQSLGIKVAKKDGKNKIVTELIKLVDKRIMKSIEELKLLLKEQLIDYFEQVQCDQEELVDLLQNIDLRSRAKSRKALVEFAAIQISSLGIFERLSDRHA